MEPQEPTTPEEPAPSTTPASEPTMNAPESTPTSEPTSAPAPEPTPMPDPMTDAPASALDQPPAAPVMPDLPASTPKKSRKKLNIILAAVVVVLGLAAYFAFTLH